MEKQIDQFLYTVWRILSKVTEPPLQYLTYMISEQVSDATEAERMSLIFRDLLNLPETISLKDAWPSCKNVLRQNFKGSSVTLPFLETLERWTNLLAGWIPSSTNNSGRSLPTPSKPITSTTVPGMTEVADAVGDRLQALLDASDLASDVHPLSSEIFGYPTVKVSAAITSYVHGSKDFEFGCEVPPSDLSCRITLYSMEGISDPQDWWKGRIRQTEIHYPKGSRWDQSISLLEKKAHRELENLGATSKKMPKRSKFF